jgi:succinate dehydrogenase/fumarate reductase flavoprotein subunit
LPLKGRKNMKEVLDIKTDVLVVGGGGGGAMAAVKAAMEGAKVVVVTKGPFPSGNTSILEGSIAAAMGDADPRDNPQVHLEDVVRAGEGLPNRKVVGAWTKEIVPLIKELDSWGAGFIKNGDKFCQDAATGYAYPRLVRSDATGASLTRCLKNASIRMGVQPLEHLIVGGLLKAGQQIVGAWGIQYLTGQLTFIHAKAVVLATGGLGHLFPLSAGVKGITGEGYVLAFRAGAELVDMEMADFQLIPCYPEEIKGRPNRAGRLIDLGARLYNGLGERFMKKIYPETGEKGLSGAVIARCIATEISEGRGSAHGGILLDASDVTPEILQKAHLASVWDKIKRDGVDLSYQPNELGLTVISFLGGARIDETGSTNVPGLFACGETAGGLHGAARMGGAAISGVLAFGSIAGKSAALYVSRSVSQSRWGEQQVQEVKNWLEVLQSTKPGIKPSDIKRQVQTIANNYLNVVRDEEGLTKALAELRRIEQEMLPQLSVWQADEKMALGLREAIEANAQVELAKIIATAALCRKESRGGHYRKDYPHRDDEKWLKNIVLKRGNSEISCRTTEVIGA